MNNTIVKPSDISIDPDTVTQIVLKCSRCKQNIYGSGLKVKAVFTLPDLRTKSFYIYHLYCIETNPLILKLNYLRFEFLSKWERLHYKLNFLNYIGLGFHQVRRRIKQKRETEKVKGKNR